MKFIKVYLVWSYQIKFKLFTKIINGVNTRESRPYEISHRSRWWRNWTASDKFQKFGSRSESGGPWGNRTSSRSCSSSGRSPSCWTFEVLGQGGWCGIQQFAPTSTKSSVLRPVQLQRECPIKLCQGSLACVCGKPYLGSCLNKCDQIWKNFTT